MGTRKLDLTTKPSTDLAADVYARIKAGAAEDTIVATAPKLTPRVVTLRLKTRNPETGLSQVVAVESTAPNADMRRRMTIEAGKLAGGVPWSSLPLVDGQYIAGLARILVQCSELPPDVRWILDSVGAVLALSEALVDHDQRYFLGDDGPSDASPVFPRVERPWADAEPGAGA